MQKSSPWPARSSVDFSTRTRVIYPSADDWYTTIFKNIIKIFGCVR